MSNYKDYHRALIGKNYIINGNFDVWQRNTSQTIDGYDSDDRWNNARTIGIIRTHSQQAFTVGQTDVPNNPKYFSRTLITSTLDSTDSFTSKVQRIESVYTLAGETATLSFWGKANSSKNIAIDFTQHFGTGGSPSAVIYGISPTTFSLTSSWQKFTVTIDIPSISGKTLGNDGNDRLGVSFFFDAGSAYDYRTNSLGHQTGTFDIAQVQLERGEVATDFEIRPPGTELFLCQRYYQEGKAYVETGANTDRYISNQNKFYCNMRTTPSIVYTDNVGNSYKITERRNAAATNNVTPSIAPSAPDNTRVAALHRNTGSPLDGYDYYWYADAEL